VITHLSTNKYWEQFIWNCNSRAPPRDFQLKQSATREQFDRFLKSKYRLITSVSTNGENSNINFTTFNFPQKGEKEYNTRKIKNKFASGELKVSASDPGKTNLHNFVLLDLEADAHGNEFTAGPVIKRSEMIKDIKRNKLFLEAKKSSPSYFKFFLKRKNLPNLQNFLTINEVENSITTSKDVASFTTHYRTYFQALPILRSFYSQSWFLRIYQIVLLLHFVLIENLLVELCCYNSR